MFIQTFVEFAVTNDTNITLSHGHQLEDLIIGGTFSMKDLVNIKDNFHYFYDAVHGNCYTFNHFSLNEPKYVYKAGLYYG